MKKTPDDLLGKDRYLFLSGLNAMCSFAFSQIENIDEDDCFATALTEYLDSITIDDNILALCRGSYYKTGVKQAWDWTADFLSLPCRRSVRNDIQDRISDIAILRINGVYNAMMV